MRGARTTLDALDWAGPVRGVVAGRARVCTGAGRAGRALTTYARRSMRALSGLGGPRAGCTVAARPAMLTRTVSAASSGVRSSTACRSPARP